MVQTLPWGAPLTEEHLAAMPEDGHRYELVDGVLLVTPAPNRRHQRCVVSLIGLFLAARHVEHEVLVAPFDVRLSRFTVLQPDVLVTRKTDEGESRLERAPLLVVEVLSPSTRLIDLGTKRLAFEAAGVPAYWLVDPSHPNLTVLHLEEGEYVEHAAVTGEQPYSATFPFPVTVVAAELVAG